MADESFDLFPHGLWQPIELLSIGKQQTKKRRLQFKGHEAPRVGLKQNRKGQ